MRRDLGSDLRGGLGFEGEVRAFLLVVDGSFDLALCLQSRDDVLILPSNFVRKSSEDAVFAVGLKAEHAKGRWDNVPLSLIIGSWNSFVGAIALHGILSTSQLVGQHTANGFVENSGWGPVVERSSLRVDQTTFAKVVHVLKLVAIKASGNVDPLTPDDDDTLPLKEGFSDDGGETAEEMTAAIDDKRLGGKTHLDHSI